MRIGAGKKMAVAGAALVCGCGPGAPAAPAGPSFEEESGIAHEVAQGLVGRTYWTGPSTRAGCDDLFIVHVERAMVRDRRISGDRGQLKIGVPVASRQPLPQPVDNRSPTRQCLAVDTAFEPDRLQIVIIDRDIERWESGWRLAARHR